MRTWTTWIPRVFGILVVAFFAAFALDATDPVDLAAHLAPAAGLLGVLGLSFRRPWIGGLVFTGLALLYAVVAHDRPDWVLAIGGPLALVGVLFLVDTATPPATAG